MSLLAVLIVALSMSVDAFAAALAKGAALHRPHWREALRTGAIFGGIEALTPVIGWVAGLAAAPFIEAIDHWIALILLGALGAKMIHESFQPREEERPSRHSFATLAVTAIGTSIDALAVGVMFALLDVNIVIGAAAIGISTFVMTSIGIMIARAVGPHLGAWAEFAGGVVLIVLGIGIFYQHTMAG